MKGFGSLKKIKIGIDFGSGLIPVGRLAIRERKIYFSEPKTYFQYAPSFIERGLKISPRWLPLKYGLFTFDDRFFEGLPGVFNDSLPDGWGRLLFDRFVRSQNISPTDITPLNRLAYVGANGIGAIVYEPDFSAEITNDAINLDKLAEQSKKFLYGTSEEVIEKLLTLNGSSAGARPKTLIGMDKSRRHIYHGMSKLSKKYEPWMVKFANTQDSSDAGAIEYVYALMAKDAGINMTDVHLFPAQNNPGYFAIKRFDREGDKRFHTHTVCGLLHSDFRMPSLDYEDLLELTYSITRDVREVEKMFQLAVFNVLAHNRDDHSKNFSFLMDEKGDWKLSPAYDLTFSSGVNGEQSTMVMGEGRSPTTHHLLKLGQAASLSKARVNQIIEQTKISLSKWKNLAKQYGVSSSNIEFIARKFAETHK